PALRLIGVAGAALIAFASGAGMTAGWVTLALYWNGAGQTAASNGGPIFFKSLHFYLFTLPAYEVIRGLLFTIAAVAPCAAGFFCAGRERHGRHRSGIRAAVVEHLAQPLDRVRRTAAGPLGARVSRPVRFPVREPHHLFRRHVHGRARHADRTAVHRRRARAR